MTEVSQEIKDKIKLWIEEGVGLSGVQSRLKEECGLALTYMDVRFMVMDLGLDVREKYSSLRTPVADDTNEAADTDDATDSDFSPGDPFEKTGVGGGVTLEISPVTRPGSMLNGTVRFSDGMTATWSLDQLGQLALAPERPDYRPSESDIRDFQAEFRKLVQQQGF